jgi:hypothetical protein
MSSGLTETFTYKGCEMTLKTEDLPEAQKSQELSSACTIRFNLKDIDPALIKLTDRSHLGDFPCTDYSDEERQSLKLNCDHTELSFSTRTGAGLIAEDWINVFRSRVGRTTKTVTPIRVAVPISSSTIRHTPVGLLRLLGGL